MDKGDGRVYAGEAVTPPSVPTVTAERKQFDIWWATQRVLGNENGCWIAWQAAHKAGLAAGRYATYSDCAYEVAGEFGMDCQLYKKLCVKADGWRATPAAPEKK